MRGRDGAGEDAIDPGSDGMDIGEPWVHDQEVALVRPPHESF